MHVEQLIRIGYREYSNALCPDSRGRIQLPWWRTWFFRCLCFAEIQQTSQHWPCPARKHKDVSFTTTVTIRD